MLPVLEGIIARRLLINFRVAPELVRPLVPAALEIVEQNGFAVVGVCLIRLEKLRPSGTPAALGLSSENMAHRIAIRYRSGGQTRDGVFIWRRETDCAAVAMLGGRFFPGVHGRAQFKVAQSENSFGIRIDTADRLADVALDAHSNVPWKATPLFGTLDEASAFFEKGACGFSCGQEGRLEGMRLNTRRWRVEPLSVGAVHSAFFARNVPAGGAEFDCAILMRDVPHSWHVIDEVPTEITERRLV